MDEQWRRIIRSKVEDERRRLEEEERLTTSSNRDLYKLFNELQGISHEFVSFFFFSFFQHKTTTKKKKKPQPVLDLHLKHQNLLLLECKVMGNHHL